MDTVKTSERDTIVSSIVSPLFAISRAPPAGYSPQSSKLSPIAAEFVVASKKPVTTFKLSAQADTFVGTSIEILPKSKLSPLAASFVARPVNQTPDHETANHVHTNCAHDYNPGKAFLESLHPIVRELALDGVEYLRTFAGAKKATAAVESCQTALSVEYNNLKQRENECARHYDAFIKWKYFERYDEPYEDQDIESMKNLAEARKFRCSKCRDQLSGLKQEFRDSTQEYMRLVTKYGEALNEHNNSVQSYNASVVHYRACTFGDMPSAAEVH